MIEIVAPAEVSANGHAPAVFDVIAYARALLPVWQARLRLLDWTIWIKSGNPSEQNPGASAETEVETRMHRAEITFRPDFLAFTRERGLTPPGHTDEDITRETLVHELLHVVERPAIDCMASEIDWAAGKGGVLGCGLRNEWISYREAFIEKVALALIAAYGKEGSQ